MNSFHAKGTKCSRKKPTIKMPQAVTNQTSALEVLHELNKSQLNVGELQISGLCARCSALGKLLTQEVTQHRISNKKNQANKLGKELNEISTKINNSLVRQLPLIKRQMEQALGQMAVEQHTPATGARAAQDQTYVKTTQLLQENICLIDQQLDGAMERIFKAVPQARTNELQKLLQSLSIYQSTLCGANVITTEFSRLSIFLSCLKSNVELYIQGLSDGPDKNKLLKFSSAIQTLTEKNKIFFETFQGQHVNNLSIMKVFDSAKQKLSNLTKQLNTGDFSNADLALAIAQRHDANSIISIGQQELERISRDYDYLAGEVMIALQQFQLEDTNSKLAELMLSEPEPTPPPPTSAKKINNLALDVAEHDVKAEPVKKPESKNEPLTPQKPSPKSFNIALAKLVDWLKHDVRALNNSRSEEKRTLGQIIDEQLDEVYGQLDHSKWPADEAEAHARNADIEKRLGALGQLIEEAMAQQSPPNTPPASRPVSPEPKAIKDTEKAVSAQKKLPVVETKKVDAPAVTSPAVETSVVGTAPAPVLSVFDTQLQTAIQKLNSARTTMFKAYSRQESFRQKLLESNQPYSVAWANVQQADMVLDFISQNIAGNVHSLYVKPYVEHYLPMAEMIHSIQAERFHPHFDQQNCQAYLRRASNWLDTFTPHFEYLEQLMSVTESMLANQHRVA